MSWSQTIKPRVSPSTTSQSRPCSVARRVDGLLRIVEEASRTAYKIVFADPAALRALRMDIDGISAVGSTLDQLAATDENLLALHNFLEAVPRAHGLALYSCAVLRGIHFKLHASCVSSTPQRVFAVWLEPIEHPTYADLCGESSFVDEVNARVQGNATTNFTLYSL